MAEVKKIATRERLRKRFGRVLSGFPQPVVLDADLAEATKDKYFRGKHIQNVILTVGLRRLI